MNDQKLKKLLKILSDGKCHSGAAIGEALGVTRAAIWKLIQQLKELNIEVVGKTNQGYCIEGGLELLNLKTIQKYLSASNKKLIDHAILFDTMPSTNTYFIEQLRQNDRGVKVCMAEHQSQGRGRFGRKWLCAFGKNIYMSLLWSFNCDMSRLSGLSLAIAVAFTRALKRLGISKDVGLKWPNDVQWQGKKIAGILIELHGESHHSCDVIIGIGVNLELPAAMREESATQVADLADILQEKPERNRALAVVLDEVVNALHQFAEKGLTPFVKEWLALDIALNKPVKILFGEKTINGIYRGIDPKQGELLLEDAHGKVHTYSSGEISLRVKRQ